MQSKVNTITKKTALLIVSAAVILMTAITITVAFIKTTATPITNTFSPTNVSCSVIESFDGESKENVCIKNTGNVHSYIRVAITANWQTETQTNQILATSPRENKDYVIITGNNTWIRANDGYWYYSEPVAPDDVTRVLFSSVKQISDSPSGYKLSFSIHAQAIQSEPQSVVIEKWGVALNDRRISPAT